VSATGSLEGHLTVDNNKQVSPRKSSATDEGFLAEDIVEVSADSTLDDQASLGKMNATVVLLESKGVGTGISSRLTQAFFKIKGDETLRLFLDDYSEVDYWPFLDALNSDEVVQKIVVFRKRQTDRVRTRSTQELDCFFHILHNLSSLRELHLWNFTQDDLQVLSNGIANHPWLEYVQLHFESGTMDYGLSKALASLPSLISLELEVNATFPAAPLLDSQSLNVLSIISNQFDFELEHITELVNKLERNSVLTVLDLEPRIPTDGLLVLMNALRTNRSLDTLQFCCHSANEEEADSLLQEVLETFSVNTNLRVIWNHSYESWSVTEGMKTKVLDVLRRNGTLEQFHVFVEDPNFWYKKNRLLLDHTNI
jgi:hypothetical protein